MSFNESKLDDVAFSSDGFNCSVRKPVAIRRKNFYGFLQTVQYSLANKKPLFGSSLFVPNNELLFYPLFSQKLSFSIIYKRISYLWNSTVPHAGERASGVSMIPIPSLILEDQHLSIIRTALQMVNLLTFYGSKLIKHGLIYPVKYDLLAY